MQAIFRFTVSLLLLLILGGCAAPVRVEWSTESEVNTAGFNLYRGESPEGPFAVKVNQQLLPPATDALLGGGDGFVDQAARPGVTYYYQLQEVEKSGAVNLHGPVESRASGLDWRHTLILGGLGVLVIILWVRAGRRSTAELRAEDAGPVGPSS
jgi:hypothetical protein